DEPPRSQQSHENRAESSRIRNDGRCFRHTRTVRVAPARSVRGPLRIGLGGVAVVKAAAGESNEAAPKGDRSRDRPVLVAEMMLTAALGVLFIGRESFWLDEAVTARIVSEPARQFWHVVTG